MEPNDTKDVTALPIQGEDAAAAKAAPNPGTLAADVQALAPILAKPAAPSVRKTPSPWAVPKKMRLREKAIQFIRDLDPEGAEPGHLARIKAYVIGEIEALPAHFTGVEVLIEGSLRPSTSDTKVIVFGHEI